MSQLISLLLFLPLGQQEAEFARSAKETLIIQWLGSVLGSFDVLPEGG